MELTYEDGRPLPRGHDSLAFGVPKAVPGAVSALALGGGYSVGPAKGRTIYFGRNRPEVHICIGEDDRQISNTGQRPIRLPRSQWLFTNESAIPLAEGYPPLFVPGSRNREHLLEVYVTGPDGSRPVSRHDEVTEPARTYKLSPDDRLILVVLGQRYLLHEASPKPLTWQQAAEALAELQPAAGWTGRKVEHRVAGRQLTQRQPAQGAGPLDHPGAARPRPAR